MSIEAQKQIRENTMVLSTFLPPAGRLIVSSLFVV